MANHQQVNANTLTLINHVSTQPTHNRLQINQPEPGCQSRPIHVKKKSSRRKTDVYQEVTNRIIERLEEGVVPWTCPWNPEVGPPANFSSKKRYNGINVLLLGSLQYESPFWLTFLQAKELGGNVKKGEKGATVLKYGTYTPKNEGEHQSEDATDESEIRGYLRHYTVFNALQIEGVTFPEPKSVLLSDERTSIEKADAIIEGMPTPPSLAEGRHPRAFYSRTHDKVNVPDRRRFETPERFYQVLFHELIHSTGHEKRLARKSLLEQKEIGDQDYSKEELVAEMGGAFLSAEANIIRDDHEVSAAYIAEWLKILKAKENKRWVVQAANQASRAARFILGTLDSDAK